MTTASIPANKAWIATAALVLVTGVAEQVPAQAPAVITGTVTNTVTGGPVTNATVRVVAGRRLSATGGDGRYRLVVDGGQSELRITAVGFAPVSQTVSFASGVSRVLDFALQPSAVPLDDVVALGTRALERTAAGSAVPVDVISAQLLENTGLNETWQQLQRVVPSVNVRTFRLATTICGR